MQITEVLIRLNPDFICKCHGIKFETKKDFYEHLAYIKGKDEERAKELLKREKELPDTFICPCHNRKFATQVSLKGHITATKRKDSNLKLICECHNKEFETFDQFITHLQYMRNYVERMLAKGTPPERVYDRLKKYKSNFWN